VSQTC